MPASTDYSAIITKLETTRDKLLDQLIAGGGSQKGWEMRGRKAEYFNIQEQLKETEKLIEMYCSKQKAAQSGRDRNTSARTRARLNY